MSLTPLLTLLKDRRSLMITVLVASVLFLFNYRLMASLPAQGQYACLIGGALTPFNLAFSALLSLLTGIMGAGLFTVLRQRQREHIMTTGSLLGVGTMVGVFTTFCTACTIPVFSLFGLSLGFGFFMTYNLAFKVVSLVFLLVGLYFLSQQLDNSCRRCVMGPKKR